MEETLGGHGQRGGREGMGTIVGGKGVNWRTGSTRKMGVCGAEEDGGHRVAHGRSDGGGGGQRGGELHPVGRR